MLVWVFALYSLSVLLMPLIRYNSRCNQTLPRTLPSIKAGFWLLQAKFHYQKWWREGGGGKGCFWMESCHQRRAAATSPLPLHTSERWQCPCPAATTLQRPVESSSHQVATSISAAPSLYPCWLKDLPRCPSDLFNPC